MDMKKIYCIYMEKNIWWKRSNVSYFWIIQCDELILFLKKDV